MNSLFRTSVEKIKQFYEEKGYSLGRRFLNGSKATLHENSNIALITLNPAGNSIHPDYPWESCENGSSYLYERWGNVLSGQSNLQNQIQLMFKKIAICSNYRGTRNDLIEKSLAGYFIPFRSPRLSQLQYNSEAFDFASNLWSEILKSVQPKLVICLDRETHKRLRSIITQACECPLKNTKEVDTGWGKYKADIDEFGDKPQVKLLRLPHLSTFKLFTSKNCNSFIDCIFDEVCDIL